MNGQFLKFRADEDAMVNHMIHSQNGTVPTAIRELLMNAIDKGARRVDVEISRTHFRVRDTGIGFASEEDVEKHFLTFGTPHQEGDATFGRFRIGRGQIMSLAKAQWHSHQFRMVTDVRNKGNGMELYIEPEQSIEGCEVSGEFYQPIGVRDEMNIRQEKQAAKSLVMQAMALLVDDGERDTFAKKTLSEEAYQEFVAAGR